MFPIRHVSNSRIDGYPVFLVDKKEIKNFDELRKYVDIELVSLLEDQLPNLPGGQKDMLAIKVSNVKQPCYLNHMRSKKLENLKIIML